MSTDFRITGIPEPRPVANVTGASVAIAAPGVGRQIIIHNILSNVDGALRETNGAGNIITYVETGPDNLAAGIKVAENTAVFATAGTMSIIYSTPRISR